MNRLKALMYGIPVMTVVIAFFWSLSWIMKYHEQMFIWGFLSIMFLLLSYVVGLCFVAFKDQKEIDRKASYRYQDTSNDVDGMM